MLRLAFGCPAMLISGVPPMRAFPALPQPLRRHLGMRASAFDTALRRDLDAEPHATFLSVDVSSDSGGMAADGFHPGPVLYAQWAEHAVATWRGLVAG